MPPLAAHCPAEKLVERFKVSRQFQRPTRKRSKNLLSNRLSAFSSIRTTQTDTVDVFIATANVKDFAVRIFSAQGSEHPNQDRWVVHPISDSTLRVAIIDGVTPWRSELVPGGDSGQFAASTVASNLLLPLSIEDAFRRANRELYNPALAPGARQTMAAAAAVDINEAMGWINCSGLVAADCEWWVAEDRSPYAHLFVGGEARTEEALEASQRRALEEPVGEDFDSRRLRESEDFADLSSFHRHAIGRCETPKFTAGEGRFNSIVLASDGARLSDAPKVSADPELIWSWLDHIENQCPRDDFTVITVCLA